MRGNKIYVWTDISCDYTCGIAVAVARNIREARAAVIKAGAHAHEIMANKPKVHAINRQKAIGFHCAGGG